MQKVLWRKNQGLSFVHAEFAMCIRQTSGDVAYTFESS